MSIYVSVKGAKTLVESLKSQEPKAKSVGPEAFDDRASSPPWRIAVSSQNFMNNLSGVADRVGGIEANDLGV